MDNIKIIYSGQNTNIIGPSIFLAGCSPRKGQTLTWRIDIVKLFAEKGFKGTIIVPEPQSGQWEDYNDVIEWEDNYLQKADVILFWLPRNISKRIYGFTTNIEFGKYLHSGKIVYGRPDSSDNTRYLDYWYRKLYGVEPFNTLSSLMEATLTKITKGRV